MSKTDDSGRRQRRIDAAAKAAFLEALRGGARREDAAEAVGFSMMGFYGARRRDPAFGAAWREALAQSSLVRRRRRSDEGELRIVPGNRRSLQRRRMKVRFTEERRAIFLRHFGWGCDARAAAAEAGVCESTVYYHRRTDPGFAGQFEEALDQAYVRLEAEAVRERLARQQALRDALDEGEVPPDCAVEFERVLKLLARRDRKPRRPERQAAPGSPRRIWTFDAAIELLDRRLKALGIAVPALPLEAAARYDQESPEGEEAS